jgi:adenosylcobinamide-GDP ribazoletransferase
MYALPYVSDSSGAKSKPLAESAGPATVLTGLAWSLPALLLLGWVHGPLSLGLAVLGWMLALGAMRRTLRRRLQGFTGDTLGATQQLCELALYLGLALRLP